MFPPETIFPHPQFGNGADGVGTQIYYSLKHTTARQRQLDRARAIFGVDFA
jgi:hypothetical protein